MWTGLCMGPAAVASVSRPCATPRRNAVGPSVLLQCSAVGGKGLGAMLRSREAGGLTSKSCGRASCRQLLAARTGAASCAASACVCSQVSSPDCIFARCPAWPPSCDAPASHHQSVLPLGCGAPSAGTRVGCALQPACVPCSALEARVARKHSSPWVLPRIWVMSSLCACIVRPASSGVSAAAPGQHTAPW